MKKQKRCPCAGETLSKLIHPVILTILAQQSAHGYQIAKLASQTPLLDGNRPDTAGVYHMLGKMEGSGHVKAASHISVNGPARKVYTLTSNGRKCLLNWTRTLSRYNNSIESLLTIARKALAKKSKPESERKQAL